MVAYLKRLTRHIVDAIKGKMEFSLPDHNVLMSDAMANMHTILQQQDEVILLTTLANSELNAKTRQAIQRAVEGMTSSWLAALPLAHHHFDLFTTEFRDALALHPLQLAGNFSNGLQSVWIMLLTARRKVNLCNVTMKLEMLLAT